MLSARWLSLGSILQPPSGLCLETKAALKEWYAENGRDLPWRHTRDPYPVLISEIMLQQTQVATGLPYWERWMRRFPTVMALADATETEVLAAWQGLGYYRRARNLHAAAKLIVANGWPESAVRWRVLPGIGEYTSGALASITLGERVPAVDGNVERVYARVTRSELTGSALSRATRDWAKQLVPADAPGDWNQAIMELGARVCKPRLADCESCPLSRDCLSHSRPDRHDFPRRKAPRKIELIVRHHAVFASDKKVALSQIAPGTWWEGMWQFPEIEGPRGTPIASERHQVTHYRILSSAYLVGKQPNGSSLIPIEQTTVLPMPAAQRRILETVLRELK